MSDSLQAHFTNALNHILTDCSTVGEGLWQTLFTHYNQPHCHYHNLGHIKAMISHFENCKPKLSNPTAVALAIYYHDVIYNPKQQDNERQSAEFFVKELGDYLDNSLLNRVSDLIIMTEKHQLIDSDDEDAKLFLDTDLSILGQASEVYQTYVHAIRQEYAHVADKDYREGRKVVLERFLQRPRLYFSEAFYSKYEQQARVNLCWEICQLVK